ncbi:MAG: 1-acyl-sn-glycerol-3-phosphate acyltransferase [Verrucomicrobiota bacterium]
MNEPAQTASRPAARNPGPSWGFRFLRACDRVLPEAIYRPARAAGTWIALANMPAQRRHSRDYLRVVLGREPRLVEVFRHFLAFEEMLMLKLRVADGRTHRGELAPGCDDFRRFLDGPENALLGTLHLAHSDLSGFLLGGEGSKRVSMIRLRVGNSRDVDRLGALFGDRVSFIWVNEGENLLYALKNAVAGGGSVAMKCDRLEFASKTAAFRFLGARRLFPFTIYHLAVIFGRPVFMSVGVPGGPGRTVIHASPRWSPDPRALARGQPRVGPRALPGLPRAGRGPAARESVLVVQLHPAQPGGRRMNAPRRCWLAFAYYFSWLLFGLGGLALNLGCAPFLLARDRERFGPRARAAARRMFAFWLDWMDASGVVEVVWHGFDRELPRGVVYAVNHPTLVDAPFLLGRLTDTVCIFKPALLRNPLIGPAALLCGYVSGDAGVDGIRAAAACVASGRSLLIFPEGTRTVDGTTLNALHPGFALIARRAGAAVQLIHVTSSPLIARKSWPWWKLPPLPARFDFTLGERIPPDADLTPAALTALVANKLRA